ncbi:glycosyl transferase [Microbispora sp. RL4-1S]|uniref:Glycosyl transferase n=1 Tax=Microbispora oryzae TaxID=2806554 RepID=A0A940WV16_9ACTN|nr:macrolide family glycosyltransferase [Microbispora oryzae]MBP2707910.1 glycosyl transferase [Microbispora oryzae]
MAGHYFFLCHPDHGHVIPTLAVVAELTRRGNRVTYLTAPSTAPLVEGAGATALTYESVYRAAHVRELEDDALGLLALLLDESGAMLERVAGLAVDRPDVIVYDTSVLHAGRILARVWGVPATQLVPVFASNAHFSFLRSIYAGADAGPDAGPDSGPDSGPGDLPGWVGEMLARIEALAAAHGITADPAELWWEVPDSNLVTLPRAFQFAGDTFDERFTFVGPCLGERRFLTDWRPPGDGLPIALLSFGTAAAERPALLRTCARGLAGLPWRTVVTLADGVDLAGLGPLPSHVEPHRWVSHVSVLRHAAVAVTHGGIGTVMEALSHGCPLVVVPTSAMNGPPARRIEELGLGRALDPVGLTPDRVAEAVLAVAADESVRRRAARMRREILASGGAARAADELERRLARAA